MGEKRLCEEFEKEMGDESFRENRCKLQVDTGYAFSGDSGHAPQLTNGVEESMFRRLSVQNT